MDDSRFFFLLSVSPFICHSQEKPDYEEISVFLYVPQLGVFETPAYLQEQDLYLPISDIFTFLKIQNTVSPGSDSVTGFFIDSDAKYVIDRVQNRINFRGKVYNLKPGDIVLTESNLYLKSDYFGEIFGLECTFQFSNLAVHLKTNYELPLIKEMRLEMMRKNLSRIKGEIKPDTIIPRSYPFFNLGMADWSITASQQVSGRSELNLSLALGSVIAGGEADITINYKKNLPFNWKQQSYYWHFVNNDLRFLRQIYLGKISGTSKSTVNGSILGFNLTNTPTRYRQSFSTYILSDYTEPGWTVELYIKNVLVDYVKADASGFFTFAVPLPYGSSTIRYRFYSPWGEERFKETSINIPLLRLPPNTFEYSVSSGIVEDYRNTRFFHVNANYGVGKRLTIGGGVEYNSSIPSGTILPFLNFSIAPASLLLVSCEYIYRVKGIGIATYRIPSGITLELNYTWYHRKQTAIVANYLENRKLTLSVPIRMTNFSAFLRLTMNQVILPVSKYFYSDFLISTSLWGVSTNFTTTAVVSDPVHPNVSSILSLGFRFPKRFLFTPQVQFDYISTRFVSAKFTLEKNLSKKSSVNLSFDHSFIVNVSSVQVGLRYELPFAQTGFSTMYNKDGAAFNQSARGSLMYDQKTHFLTGNNRTSVGKGGLVFLAFLDLNSNGRRDKNEPKVGGLKLKISGGQFYNDLKDTIIRVSGLEPFTNYFVELENNFNNVAWQLKKKTLNIAIDPNKFKLIEIPITVAGEASGMIYLSKNQEKEGQARITVCFYDSGSRVVMRTLSESDGFFSYLGLSPGSYTVTIDSSQLKDLKMVAEPENLKIKILQTEEGDVVDGLEFVLYSIDKDTSENIEKMIKYDSISVPLKQVIPLPEKKQDIPPQGIKIPLPAHQKLTPDTSGNMVDIKGIIVQAGAFKNQANAIALKSRLASAFNRQVLIIYEGGFYKVRIHGFITRKEASGFILKLSGKGVTGAFIVKNKP